MPAAMPAGMRRYSVSRSRGAMAGSSVSSTRSSFQPRPDAIMCTDCGSPTWRTVPSVIARRNWLRLSPAPTLRCRGSRRVRASTTRVTETRVTSAQGAVSMRASASMAYPGLTPVARTETFLAAAALSMSRQAGCCSGTGKASSSHVVTTCMPRWIVRWGPGRYGRPSGCASALYLQAGDLLLRVRGEDHRGTDRQEGREVLAAGLEGHFVEAFGRHADQAALRPLRSQRLVVDLDAGFALDH